MSILKRTVLSNAPTNGLTHHFILNSIVNNTIANELGGSASIIGSSPSIVTDVRDVIELVGSQGASLGNVLNFGSSPFSIVGFIKTTSNSMQVVAKYWGTDLQRSWFMGIGKISSGNLGFAASTDGVSATTYDSGIKINDGKWHLVAAVRNGTTLTLYSDLIPVVFNNFPSTLYSNANECTLFLEKKLDGTLGSYYTGRSSNIRIYNRALSLLEISDIYYSLLSKEAKLNFHDGTEFLPVTTQGKEYQVKPDFNTSIYNGKVVSLKLDDREYKYTIKSKDTIYKILSGLKDSLNCKLPLVGGKYTEQFTGVDGSLPDVRRWMPFGLYSIAANKLRLGTDTSVNTSYILSNFYLVGNFDVQIDFSNFMNTTIASSAILFNAYAVGTNSYLDLRREYVGSGRYGFYEQAPTTTKTVTNTTDQSGKFRYARSGSTITAYRWDGTSWVSMGTSTLLGTADIYFKVINSYWIAASTFDVYFDNFVINSADSIIWDKDKYIFDLQAKTITKPMPTIQNCSDTFDDIDEASLSNFNWINIIPSSETSSKILNNKLRNTVSISSSIIYNENLVVLTGDFDIQVDFDLISWPDTSGLSSIYATLFLYSVGTSNVYITVSREAVGPTFTSTVDGYRIGNEFYAVAYTNNWSNLAFKGKAATSLISSGLRVVRVGNILTIFYKNGTNWIQFATGTDTNLGVPLAVQLKTQTDQMTNLPLVVDWNNFTINSATTLSWQSGYDTYTEDEELRIKPRPFIYDDFTGNNGDAPNDKIWNVVSTETSPVVINNNRLKLSHIVGDPHVYPISKFKLVGDFDVQIDYDVTGYPWVDDGWRLWFQLMNGTRTVSIGPCYGNYGSPWGFNMETRYNMGSSEVKYPTTSSFAMPPVKGTLKFKRIGSIIYFYFWNSGGWNNLYTLNFGLDDLQVIGRVSSWGSNNISGFYLDNFKILYADNITIPGTYVPDKYLVTKDYASDNFDGADGSLPDIRRWDSLIQGGVIEKFANRLRIQKSSNLPVNYDAILSRFILIGNFEIEIDYEKEALPVSGCSFGLDIISEPSSKVAYIRCYSAPDDRIMFRNSSGQTTTNAEIFSTTGKFRIKRSNSSVYLYHIKSDGTITLGYQDDLFGTENIIIRPIQVAGATLGSTMTNYLDNFKINSADAIYIDEANIVPRVELNTDIVSTKKLPYLKLLN